jgi:hypothetical protein
VFSLPLRITDQEVQPASRGSFLQPLRDFLAEADPPTRSDVIFVLAGRPERKVYGLQLFREGFAPRLILSVGRFEVRGMGGLGFNDLNLREGVARLPPEQRHFFIDIVAHSRRVIVRGEAGRGTYAELLSLGRYLEAEGISSLLLVSTSIHLGRIRYCCRRIALFSGTEIGYVSVPENLSSFRRAGWWKRRDHWSYVLRESAKLGIFLLRPPRETR